MKKFIEKINWKIVLIITVTILYEIILFNIGHYFNGVLVTTKFDEAIPFISEFVWFYIIWFPCMIFVPYILGIYDKDNFKKYTICFVLGTTVAFGCFAAFPILITRYTGEFVSLSDKIVELVYFVEKVPSSCLPSIHAMTSFLFIFATFNNKNTSKWFNWILFVVSIGIAASTLFIKQHIYYDVVAAFVIAIILWIIVSKTKLYTKIKFLNKLID